MAIGGALALRADDLTRDWHDRLRRRPAWAPERAIPGEALETDVPEIVDWVARRLHEEPSADPSAADLTAPLRSLVRHYRARGHTIEALLVELRILGEVLGDGLVAEIDAGHAELPPGRAAAIACRLAAAMQEVVARAGALYREEELVTERGVGGRLQEFTRILTHELIDPLSAADLAAQALATLDLGGDERIRDYAGRVQTAVRRAARVVEGVRSLTRADEEPAVVEVQPLRTVVGRVIDGTRAAAGAAAVEVAVDGSVPDVSVDGGRVEIVLHNMLTNAVRYADPDKPERWARLRASLDGATLAIEVSDNGLGIPPAEQSRIFEPLYRAHHHVADGHGLGLAIARVAVRQMGGAIRCESAPGEGSTFSFTIPIGELPGTAEG